MENRKIIIILLTIIVIMLVALLAFVMSSNAKTDTAISITSENHLMDGDSVTLNLNDANSKPLAGQKVNVVIIDENGEKNSQEITTDSEGIASLVLSGITPGTYTIEVSYGGDLFYSSCQDSQIVVINELTGTEETSESRTVTLELANYDEKVTKTVGEYRIEAEKWSGTSIGGLGIWVYKNGVLVDRYSYTTRVYFLMDGEWKWSQWDYGEVDSTYHKYNVGNGVEIERVEVSF